MKYKIHFRRCHICGQVSKAQGRLVDKCEYCLKPMIPFFYFDENTVSIYVDNLERPPMIDGEMRPLRGLTVIWEADRI